MKYIKKNLLCWLLVVVLVLSACGAPSGGNYSPNTPNDEIFSTDTPIDGDDSTADDEISDGSIADDEFPPKDENDEPDDIEEPNEQDPDSGKNEDNDLAPTPEPLPNTATYVRVLVNSLSVRAGAGTNYSVVASFDAGDLLVFSGISGDWYVTQCKGKVCYVSSSQKYTELVQLPLSANNEVEKVIQFGVKFLGVPYVYGATRYVYENGALVSGFSESAFDCSSLMQYIFFKGAGVTLGLTTRTQVLQGRAVAASQLQRGDLMFFTNSSRVNNVGIERVGHVALYLGGNYILHTASDYAVIEQISAQRWAYLIECRRMIG